MKRGLHGGVERLVPWTGVARKCVRPGETWKTSCVHAESHAWKTGHPGGLRAACCPHGSAAAMLEGEQLHLVLPLLLLLLLVLVLVLRRSLRCERSMVSCHEQG